MFADGELVDNILIGFYDMASRNDENSSEQTLSLDNKKWVFLVQHHGPYCCVGTWKPIVGQTTFATVRSLFPLIINFSVPAFNLRRK